MATTLITIEFIGNIDIKVTINGQSFQGFYDKSLRDQAAIKAIEQAHFDEIFDVRVVSKGVPDLEQARLTKFKKALQSRINASPELNLMIKRDVHEAEYNYYTNLRNRQLPHSQEMQLKMLKEESNIDPKKATQSEITEMLKKHEKELKSQILTENYGILLMTLSMAFATIVGIFAPVLLIIPVVVLSIGLGLIAYSDIKHGNLKKTADLFKRLKKLDPDFIAQLESQPLVRPEPQVEVENVSIPEVEPPPPPYIISGPQSELDIKASAAPLEPPPPYLDEDPPVKPETPRKKTF